jgi:hypothetical protein
MYQYLDDNKNVEGISVTPEYSVQSQSKSRDRTDCLATLNLMVTYAISDGTPVDAIQLSAIVGTILTAINQGDSILIGHYPPFYKVVLTYLVPYCVATVSAVRTKLRMRSTDDNNLVIV